MKKVREIPSFVYDPSCVLYLPLWKRDANNGDSFISDDAYGHKCTVTGATWGINGRTFDGTDDSIISVAHKAFEVTAATGFTIGGWFNKTEADLNMLGVGISDEPTQAQRIELWVQMNNAGTNKVRVFSANGGGSTAITAISAGVFHHLFASQAAGAGGNNCLIYLDGVLHASVPVVGYPAWTSGAIKYCVGNNSNSLPLKGLVGEAFGFNRGLTALEIHQIYLSTKRRYQ